MIALSSNINLSIFSGNCISKGRHSVVCGDRSSSSGGSNKTCTKKRINDRRKKGRRW